MEINQLLSMFRLKQEGSFLGILSLFFEGIFKIFKNRLSSSEKKTLLF